MMYLKGQCIQDIFIDIAKKQPHKLALIYNETELTYKDIEDKSNQLCALLISEQVKNKTAVGVFLERSPNTAISILGILKAGYIYVPLDLTYPESHIQSIIDDVGLNIIISQDKLKNKLIFSGAKIINIETLDETKTYTKLKKVNTNKTIDNDSFILFTSGSTNKPKGVIHGQRTILNYLHWIWEAYPFEEDDRTCQRTNINFMPSILEFFWGLLKGITTVIIPDDITRDPIKLIDMLTEKRITRIRVVPTLLKMILDSCTNLNEKLFLLKIWITAGEPLNLELFKRFVNTMPNAILLNEYGSTETNGLLVFDTRYYSEHMKTIPVGKPISNTKVYLLNDNKQIAPIGTSGEIYASGDGLMKKYLNLPELTEEKLIKNTFNVQLPEILYSTGDYALYLPDGNIEYLGRRDNQIKIRGKRIELTQVEAILSTYPHIKENAVFANEKALQDKSLIACIVFVEGAKASVIDIRNYLESKLPDYMIPSRFIKVKSLPRTPNGKLDRKQLPFLLGEKNICIEDTSLTDDCITADGVISALRNILSEVLELNVKEIDVRENFKNLGMDSVSAVRFNTMLNKEFNTGISVTALFDYSNINELSNYIVKSSNQFKGYEHVATVKNEMKIEGRPVDSDNAYCDQRDSEKGLIAVIGVSGCFPGAKNLDEFWGILRDGKSLITDVPAKRWDIDEYYDSDPKKANKSISKVGGFISDVDQFEPLFFNISEREAKLMDPQQRLSLMECWRTFEDAGYAPNKLSGSKTGVFIGVRQGDYVNRIRETGIEPDAYTLMGNDTSILAARVSYFLNLKGTNISINTACSSSLVAIHSAIQSILAGDCEMALAGGVCVLSSHQFFIETSKAGMFSPTDSCKAFDNKADGMVPGEAAAFVLLKPLNQAIIDGDNIYGVIRASGINQDGKTNGITAPSTTSQAELELSVYNKANINPETISYVEAHGTGTKLGDPIEVEALTEAFRKFTNKNQFCAIGSVKTNIGHTIAAAGVAGLVKVLLSLKHKKIPPSLNFHEANEHINFLKSPFYVSTKMQDWSVENDYPMRAALSSFGYSGTNSHFVLEEYNGGNTPCELSESHIPYFIIPVSAKANKSADLIIASLLNWLKNNLEETSLKNVAYTLQTGRCHFAVRYVFIARNIEELIEKLEAVSKGENCDGVFSSEKAKTDGNSEQLGTKAHEIMQELRKDLVDEQYKEKLVELARLYIKHADIEWENLYRDNIRIKKISLPTYVFNTKSFWIDNSPKNNSAHLPIHPFIDQNVSDLYEQRYIKHFRSSEKYVLDHMIDGKKILAGMVLLEVVNAAGELAGRSTVRCIRNVKWLKPAIVADTGTDIQIALSPKENIVEFDIFAQESTESASRNNIGRENRITFSKGEIDFNKEDLQYKCTEIDIESIKARCSQVVVNSLYDFYSARKIDYGESFRLCKELLKNEQESISYIELKTSSQNIIKDLYPTLMDCALHSTTGAFLSKDGGNATFLPLMLEKATIYHEMEKEVYAYCHLKQWHRNILVFDIFITDRLGRVLRALEGFTLQAVDNGLALKNKKETQAFFYKKVWIDQPISFSNAGSNLENTVIFDSDTKLSNEFCKNQPAVLVLPDTEYKSRNKLIFSMNPECSDDYVKLFRALGEKGIGVSNIIYLWSKINSGNSTDPCHYLGNKIYALTYLTQALLKEKVEGVIKLLYFYEGKNSSISFFDEAMGGFVKVVRKENPNYVFKTISVSGLENTGVLARIAANELLSNCSSYEIKYEGTQLNRRIKVLEEMNIDGSR